MIGLSMDEALNRKRPAANRSVAMAGSGMVVTSNSLASLVGVDVLREGGNAIDAAVAIDALMGVLQPQMCGIGGETFLLYYEAASGKVTALDGGGRAPRRATRDHFLAQGYEKLPLEGMQAMTVPGNVDAMTRALARWGTGRFSLSNLMEPAIHYAENGFPVGFWCSLSMHGQRRRVAPFPSTMKIYASNGELKKPGDRLVQKDLADTLRQIAQGGRDEFYTGEIADAIVAYMKDHDGLFTMEDLRDYEATFVDPVSVPYRGFRMYTPPPPSQGVLLLEELALAERFEWKALGQNTAESIHRLVEIKKLAFADRNKWLGDPDHADLPFEKLLAADYIEARRRELDLERAADYVTPGDPRGYGEQDGDTTYFCVVDEEGNAVSYVTSLSNHFGCCEVIDGTGIILNNRLSRGFTLEADHPNSVAPGKKPMSTLHCYLLTRDGRPCLVGGTPGGDAQPQINLQVITNIVDYGMNVQAAVESPRWRSFPGTDPTDLDKPLELWLEEGIDPEVADALAEKGHKVKWLGPLMGTGGANVIYVDPDTGVLQGGSDPRNDGSAVGY